MAGSTGNAFSDLLRRLAPASVPPWVMVVLAALVSAAVGLALVRFLELTAGRLERKLAPPAQPSVPPTLALAVAVAALAAYPFAPHVFFADVELGALLVVALLSTATLTDPRRAAGWIPLASALLVPVAIGGSLNLIEASRLQSSWLGLGWFVFRNPFGLPALCLFMVAVLEVTRREEIVATFLLCALAAAFFLGGFESPLTFALRQSLGEDPGFLNHVTMADGSRQTHVAVGGLVFQLASASTLIAKSMLCMFVVMRLRSAPRGRWARVASLPGIQLASLALVALLGAGLWEWARTALWSKA